LLRVLISQFEDVPGHGTFLPTARRLLLLRSHQLRRRRVPVLPPAGDGGEVPRADRETLHAGSERAAQRLRPTALRHNGTVLENVF